jgi:hypothetical protein
VGGKGGQTSLELINVLLLNSMQYAQKSFQKGSVDAMATTKYHQSGATPAISGTKSLERVSSSNMEFCLHSFHFFSC